MRIDERLRPLVRTDAVARIVSEGLVGARVVELAPGAASSPSAGELDLIGSEPPIEMNDLLKQASASLARLDQATRAAEAGLTELTAITQSVRRGEGTLGKLVRDDEVYQRLVSLTQRGERTLEALDDNLAALKETWPLSRYFERRAYFDRERVLFQPGATRNSRVIRADDLFEPGRSVLTPGRSDSSRRDRPLVQEGGPADLAGRHRRLHRRGPKPRPGRSPHPGTGGVRAQLPHRETQHPVGRLVQDCARSPRSASAPRRLQASIPAPPSRAAPHRSDPLYPANVARSPPGDPSCLEHPKETAPVRLIGPSIALPLAFFIARPSSAAEPKVVDLWPGKPPGDAGIKGEETSRIHQSPLVGPTRLITNVTKPTLTIYPAPSDKNTGTAMVICPGGGYWDLYWELEGEEVAAWLNSVGMTGIILKYRCPRRPGDVRGEPPLGPQLDAQRAISLVRSRAAEWGIDPKRIGIVGFSAGGHLALATATGFGKRLYPPLDAVDQVSCRPDFAVACYSGYLKDKDKDEIRPGFRIPADTPPVFLAHASDDNTSYGGSISENSAIMYMALKRAGVPTELHIYATGDHDFGVRQNEKLPSSWPQLCVKWLQSRGLLRTALTAMRHPTVPATLLSPTHSYQATLLSLTAPSSRRVDGRAASALA